MAHDPLANYLRDFGDLPRGLAVTARDRARSGDAFAKGRAMGLLEAVSLAAQQADAFGLSRADVGLDAVDPGRDLV